MTQAIEDILVRIDAQTESLRREMRRADQAVGQSTQRVNRNLRQVDQRMRRMQRTARTASRALGAIGAGVSTAGLQRMGSSALQTADSLRDLEQSTSVAVETIQGARRHFEQFGLDSGRTDKALEQFNSRLGQAAEGGNRYADTLERLGVEVSDTEGTLRDTLDALAQIETQHERAAAAAALFGDEVGRQMAGALREGSAAVDQQIERLRESGRLMSEDMVEAGADAQYQLEEFGRSAREGFDVGFVQQFTDALGETETATDSLAESGNALGTVLGEVLSSAVRDANAFAETIQAIRDLDARAAASGIMEGGGIVPRLYREGQDSQVHQFIR